MTFSDYLGMKHALTLEEMQQIYDEMLSEISNDEEASELYLELLQKAIRYTKTRAQWSLMTKEEKMEADQGRTMLHDSLIVSFDVLARYLRSKGKNAGWWDKLGDVARDPSVRKRLGDMAAYAVFMEALSQR